MKYSDVVRDAGRARRTLVFHAPLPVPRNLHSLLHRFPSSYRLVAAVKTEDLDEAFALTNHTYDTLEANDRVVPYVDAYRSTSVGDVLVTPDGKAHLCLSKGWQALDTVV